MCVGQSQPFKQALHTAVFAPAAMQGVETDIRGKIGQNGSQVTAGIDLVNLKPLVPQSGRAFAP